MKNWNQLADEVYEWEFRSYGRHGDRWQLLLGVIEEAGEFVEAKENNSREGMIDSLADGAIYLINLCKSVGCSMPMPNMEIRYTTDCLTRAFGMASHGILKSSLGIRRMSESKVHDRIMKMATIWISWAYQQALIFALPAMLVMVNETWAKVVKRDWKSSPDDGVPVPTPVNDTEPVQPPSTHCHPGKRCTAWPECESCGPARL